MDYEQVGDILAGCVAGLDIAGFGRRPADVSLFLFFDDLTAHGDRISVTDNQVPEATSSVLWEAGLVVLCGDKASAGRVVPSHPEMNATVNSKFCWVNYTYRLSFYFSLTDYFFPLFFLAAPSPRFIGV